MRAGHFGAMLQGSAMNGSYAFATGATVVVEAPARLHLGFLDPDASLGRRFGSLGVVIDGMAAVLELGRAPQPGGNVIEAGDHTERLRSHLERLQAATGRKEPVRVRLRQAPPTHAGFGSGTQLALALGRAFSTLHGLAIPTPALATLLGRGDRSGIGIAGFDEGGLLLDAGRGRAGTAAPVVSRIAFPEAWRIVLVMDPRKSGLCGEAERAAMANLPPFPEKRAAALCHQVLMRVLPGAAEGEIEAFAAGVSGLQAEIGAYFAPHQGGSMFTSPAVRQALKWIAAATTAAVGQSSWGPTGFAIVASVDEARRVLAGARAAGQIDPALRTAIVAGRNRGATVALAGAGRAAVDAQGCRSEA